MTFNQTKFKKDFFIARRNKEIKKGVPMYQSEISKEINISRSSLIRSLDNKNLQYTSTKVKMCQWMGTKIDDYINI